MCVCVCVYGNVFYSHNNSQTFSNTAIKFLVNQWTTHRLFDWIASIQTLDSNVLNGICTDVTKGIHLWQTTIRSKWNEFDNLFEVSSKKLNYLYLIVHWNFLINLKTYSKSMMEILETFSFNPIIESVVREENTLKSHQDLVHLKINMLEHVLTQRILQKIEVLTKTDRFSERPDGKDKMFSDIYFREKGVIETKTRKTFPPVICKYTKMSLSHLLW